MSGYKVEICGVNTSKLPLLTNEEKEELKLFTLLCLLSFDVYIKKTLIESVIDSMTSEN